LPHPNQSAVQVKPGCAIPAPDKRKARAAHQKESPTSEQFVEGILAGDRSLLARAITLVESSRVADRQTAEQILEGCLPSGGGSIRVGVTGVPGAGKSSLIEALGKHLITQRGEKVAVLAIDPSSQLSGGSILGDKTRMPFLASSEMAFIRPSPSRGIHGGVAQRTREAILLCEAAGYRNILVETVGVGQSEAAVREMVDFFLIVSIPRAGDELQGIKRGVMELADVVAVNKADGDNLAAAERARGETESALHFLPVTASGWRPRAIVCSAHTGSGVADLWSCVLEYIATTTANGWFEQARREQSRRSMREILEQGLMEMFRADPVVQQQLAALELRVIARETSTIGAVRDLLALFASRIGTGTGG
jgi:LAO/AO transport system kinase